MTLWCRWDGSCREEETDDSNFRCFSPSPAQKRSSCFIKHSSHILSCSNHWIWTIFFLLHQSYMSFEFKIRQRNDCDVWILWVSFCFFSKRPDSRPRCDTRLKSTRIMEETPSPFWPHYLQIVSFTACRDLCILFGNQWRFIPGGGGGKQGSGDITSILRVMSSVKSGFDWSTLPPSTDSVPSRSQKERRGGHVEQKTR